MELSTLKKKNRELYLLLALLPAEAREALHLLLRLPLVHPHVDQLAQGEHVPKRKSISILDSVSAQIYWLSFTALLVIYYTQKYNTELLMRQSSSSNTSIVPLEGERQYLVNSEIKISSGLAGQNIDKCLYFLTL